MAEVIITPDVEVLVASYFQAELDARLSAPGAYVATRVPNPRPSKFVRVLITGGGGRVAKVIDEVTVTVEAYAEREGDAYVLAQLCRGLLHVIDVVDGVQFYRVEDFSTPANLPDPSIPDRVRYTASYAVRVRGSAE